MRPSTSKQPEENVWTYLPHATVSDIWTQVRTWGLIWLFVTIIMVVIGLGANVAATSLGTTNLKESVPTVPYWVWLTALFGALLWFKRGQSIELPFPRVGIVSWAVLVLAFATMFYAFENAPWWVAGSIFWAVITSLGCLDSLAEKGKANYEKLNPQESNDL